MLTGALSPARSTLADIRRRLTARAPSVAALVAGKMAALEARKVEAEGIASARLNAELDALHEVQNLRRKKTHLLASATPGRQPDPEKLAALDAEIADAVADHAQKKQARERAKVAAMEARRAFEHNSEKLATTSPDAITVAAEPKVPEGATLESIRSKIGQTDIEAERVRAAPRDRKSLIEALRHEIDEIAEKGAPKIDARRRDGQPARLANNLMIANTGTGSLIGDAGASFFVWLLRDQIVARLTELVTDAPGALTGAQRDKRLSELAAEKLHLERVEECLVEQAEAEGRKVQRRPDADVCAILGIQVKGARP